MAQPNAVPSGTSEPPAPAAPAQPPAQQLVTLTIDGHSVSVPKGTVIWAAARQLGIEIPIYCYHPKMDPLGACRMCFVEVERMPKLATACTTEVAEGMEVRTDTPKVKKGRAGTLEFLLISHPLDCPICDKGGECDLQDFTLRYGPSGSRFDLRKRHFPKPVPVSENILLDRERCIACQRCVRFCHEVAMEPGLVMKERGFRTEVGVEEEAPFDSIFSGNVVEMCPVGALTATNYRFTTRPWELRRTASVCANCSVGCNVTVDVRVNKALRQYSRTNDAIDDGWLCDRGRWQLDQINSGQRLTTPLVRRNGTLQPTTWTEALAFVAASLREILRASGPEALGGIGSTHTTNEESYLFQKLLRSLGTNNIDHYHGRFPSTGKFTAEDAEFAEKTRRDRSQRIAKDRKGQTTISETAGALTDHPADSATSASSSLRPLRFDSGPPFVWTGSIAGLDEASHIVLLGTDTYSRQPIIDLRIRKAIRRGARVHVLSSEPTRLDRLAASVVRYKPGQTGAVARALLAFVFAEGKTRGAYAERHSRELAARSQELGAPAPDASSAGVALDVLRKLAGDIASAPAATILYDEMATREPDAETLAADVLLMALATDNVDRPGASAGPLLEDNNSLGARDMGVLPDTLPGYRSLADDSARGALGAAWNLPLSARPGLDYDQMLARDRGGVRALYVMGANPARHATPKQLAAIENLSLLVVQDLFLTETAQRAHVVLPTLSYAEKDGTFTNTERCVQVVRKAMTPLPGARADWEILTALADELGLGWRYGSPAEILAEIARTTSIYAGASRRALGQGGARWPLRPGPVDAAGRASVIGTDSLAWDTHI
jgi:NADH-quinone oxidoreductase subunit G